jgi:MAF protein
MKRIILGSSSPFRRQLLEKLGLAFECHSPDIDESIQEGETADSLVLRLAASKARAVAERFPDALIIASDQVSVLDGKINGKPGTRDRAIAQLAASTGKTVRFVTGLSVLDSGTGRQITRKEDFLVHFRELSAAAITRYVDQEQPFNCAGSFKSEGLGISLFRALEGRDPNALIGLPLILLISMLAEFGLEIP